jgi:hypothetical protein
LILPCVAQTLSARPAVFGDPVLSTDPTRGELELGRTTLAAALRMFAVELADSRHEQLVMVGAERSRLPRQLRREDLVARHPTLRVRRH